MQTEESLYRGCKKYKKNVQKNVYDTYLNLMSGICFRYAQDDHQLNDILQEGFVKIFTNIKKFKWKGLGSFEAWMKKVMINTAISYYHRNKKYSNEISYEIGDVNDDDKSLNYIESNSTCVNYESERFTQDEIMQVLQSLPESFRLVFNLIAIEGYSHKEAAGLLKIKEETSRSRLSRAKQQLKEKLLALEI